MSLSRNLSLLLFASLAFSKHSYPNYFSYYDCDDSCIARNLSCLIALSGTEFVRPCSLSPQVCESEATPTMVCLRPSLPPVGGESIWFTFKSRYYSNSSDPQSDKIKLQTKLIIFTSSLAAVLMAVLLFLLTAIIFKTKPSINHIPYQPLQTADPDIPPNPYSSSTTVQKANDAPN